MTDEPVADIGMTPEPVTDIGTELLFENELLRVWSMTLAPGESSPVHRHTRDWLYVYVTEPNELETHFASGQRVPGRFFDGYVAFHNVGDGQDPDLVHALHNSGSQTHRQILVELKSDPDMTLPAGRSDNGRREAPIQG